MGKRIGIGIALGIVVGLAIGIYSLLSNLNSIVAGVIEKAGTETTGQKVEVFGVDIALRDGRGAIENLTVASPAGFEAEHVFSLGAIAVDLDLESVRDEVLVIEEVRVSAPVVTAEFDEKGGTNLDALRKRLQELAADGGDGGGSSDKKMRVESFVFEKGRIEVDASALGVEPRAVDLPAIRLENIGGTGGTDAAGLARAVTDAVLDRAVREVASAGIRGAVEDKVKDTVGDKAKDLLNKLGG